MADFCEKGYEPSGYMKFWGFLHYSELLKKEVISMRLVLQIFVKTIGLV